MNQQPLNNNSIKKEIPLDLKDAKSAFSTFFKNDNTATKNNTASTSNDPVKAVLDQASKNSTPPNKREVTKVDAQQTGAVNSMSVDVAESIIESKKTFKEILSELNIKFSELFAIIDDILSKGYYEERFSIKNFEFAFRSKKVHSISAINDSLDGSKYVTHNAAANLLLERSLASSLIYFKLGSGTANIFSHETEDDDYKVLEFVRSLHSPIYAMMANKLQRFDLLVGLAAREEALDHFLEHTQD